MRTHITLAGELDTSETRLAGRLLTAVPPRVAFTSQLEVLESRVSQISLGLSMLPMYWKQSLRRKQGC